jgi:hypothetical protein
MQDMATTPTDRLRDQIRALTAENGALRAREVPEFVRQSRLTAPPYPFRPATMTWDEAARYAFRKTGEWLRQHRPHDFPRPHPIHNVFSVEKVEDWVRSQFDLDAPVAKAVRRPRRRGGDEPDQT